MSEPPKPNPSVTQRLVVPSKTSRSINATAWDGHLNEKQFMDALTRFMNESWAAVCQIRERSGLSSHYEMSSSEISKRIEDVSKKLEDKYKEVQALEAQKAQLLTKSSSPPRTTGAPGTPLPANFQPVASSTPAQRHGYSGNYDMSYSGVSGSSGWPSTTASSGGSSRKKLQFTQGSSGSCPPTCTSLSGQYQSFEGVDYGF